MKILVIKMSSLGDVIHTLPAISDIKIAYPNADITWLVEPSFAEVLQWHPGVNNIIKIPLRNLKKNKNKLCSYRKIFSTIKHIKMKHYDIIIDAQGLLKSAIIGSFAHGKKYGYCHKSAKEPISSSLYHKTFTISKRLHAVERTKLLCSSVLSYKNRDITNYGIITENVKRKNQIICFHGTTWENKHYPVEYWQQIITKLNNLNYEILLPWGNEIEYKRAKNLADCCPCKVLPKTNLTELKDIIAKSKAAVGVDTGLSHLAAATSTPCIGIYGPTNPSLSRNYGHKQQQISATTNCAPCMKRTCHIADLEKIRPCMESIKPEIVLTAMQKILADN